MAYFYSPHRRAHGIDFKRVHRLTMAKLARMRADEKRQEQQARERVAERRINILLFACLMAASCLAYSTIT